MFDKKKLLEIIKYLPAFLIFLGSLRLIIYYKAFGINIIDYLEFSEILLSFFNSFLLLIATVIVPLIIIIGLWGNQIGDENSNGFLETIQLTFRQRLKNDIKSFSFRISIVFLAVILILFLIGKLDIYLFVSFGYFVALNFSLYIIREMRISNIRSNNRDFPATYINISVLFILIILFTIQTTYEEIESVKKNFKYEYSKVILDNESIISDRFTTYVGKTNNFIFFYYYDKNSYKAIPISRVREINIIRNKK